MLPGKGDVSFKPEFFLRRSPNFDPEVAASVLGYDEDIERAVVCVCVCYITSSVRVGWPHTWCRMRVVVRRERGGNGVRIMPLNP